MKTIRSLTESFIYPFLEKFTDMVYRGGEDTVFEGIRVLDDDIKFTQGALVNAAATLYAYYVRVGDGRADEVLNRMHYFIKLAAGSVCKTWGKIAILRGFDTLRRAGLLDRISDELVELVKVKTEYDDFFDKERLQTRGMAANYIQVAMACAGYREMLGWENDGYSEKIKEKLIAVMRDKSVNGWMDDEPPYGRFDRYSLVLSAEFADTAVAAGLDTPEFVRENLRLAAEAVLFMANGRGDGISYGRSVSCHGDGTVIEILSTAFREGQIKDSERELAIAYSIRIIEKLIGFWYNSERGCFDMWWGGRGSNDYRPIDRILETNLDMANHLFMALRGFEEAGVADIEPSASLPEPEEWQSYELDFIKREDEVKKLVILRKGDTLAMLPFVGLGRNFGLRSAYAPFPAVCRVLEASPTASYAYMVPEYEDGSGKKYRPMQYFDAVSVCNREDRVSVRAEGWLTLDTGATPERSPYRFTINFEIEGDSVSASFSTDSSFKAARMITGANSGGARITTFGFGSYEEICTEGRADFKGIHGAIGDARMNITENPDVIGYTAKII